MITTEPPGPRRCLVDTNVLLRLSQPLEDAPAAHRALLLLRERNLSLVTAFQNVAEFWNVSTRPAAHTGLGLKPATVRSNLRIIEAEFEIINEDSESYNQGLDLLAAHKVFGGQVHDPRLVALMLVRGIPTLLTSNIADFARYPQIQLLDPERMD
jgi:predicted nucleic acid-binding protein